MKVREKMLAHTARLVLACTSTLVLACVLSDCATTSKQVITDVQQCEQKVSKDAVGDLFPAVLGILSGGASSWQQQLEALGEKLGMDAVLCAVQAVVQDVKKGPPTSVTTSVGVNQTAARMRLAAAVAGDEQAVQSRADQFLQAHKVAH